MVLTLSKNFKILLSSHRYPNRLPSNLARTCEFRTSLVISDLRLGFYPCTACISWRTEPQLLDPHRLRHSISIEETTQNLPTTSHSALQILKAFASDFLGSFTQPAKISGGTRNYTSCWQCTLIMPPQYTYPAVPYFSMHLPCCALFFCALTLRACDGHM